MDSSSDTNIRVNVPDIDLSKMMRSCLNPECRRPIEECNGFVIIRDFLAFLAGKLSPQKVRELCGICRERIYGNPEEFIRLLERTEPT